MPPRSTYNAQIRSEAMRSRREGPPGTYSENRKTWTSDMPLGAVVYEKNDETYGRSVQLYLNVMRNRQPFKMYLTSLRPDELAVLKEVIDDAFERAIAISERNHEQRLEAYRNGETPHLSLYRAEPSVHHADEVPAAVKAEGDHEPIAASSSDEDPE